MILLGPAAYLAFQLHSALERPIRQIKGIGGLLEVVRRGDASALRQLLENGADANASYDHSGDEYPLLAIAVERGDVESAALLLERGADPNKGLKHQRKSPLMIAAAKGDARAAEL